MLVLRRKPGQWIDITHAKTGELLRIRVDFGPDRPNQVSLSFDDSVRNFDIQRPDREREQDHRGTRNVTHRVDAPHV